MRLQLNHRIGVFMSALVLCATAGAETPAYRDAAGFGDDDTLGAVNHLSNAGTVRAAGLVRQGKRYSLAVVTSSETPAWGERKYAMEVVGLPIPGTNKILGHDDRVITHLGMGTQLDGLGHAGLDGKFYGGLEAGQFATPEGLSRLGTEHIPPIVTRGVLLDVAGHLDVERLGPTQVIDRALLEATAKAQDIELRAGDVVLIHTGWMAIMNEDPATYISTQPGIDTSAATYLAELGAVAIGSDTSALEVQPSTDPAHIVPVHGVLLANYGVYILENIVTEELAADRAWEFLFVLGQPRLAGSVQAIIHPVAIR